MGEGRVVRREAALSWERLSVRDGRADDDGPYDGVPGHLYQPVAMWVDRVFGGMPKSYSDTRNGPRLAAAIHWSISPNVSLTVHNITKSLYRYPDRLLDAVDAVLHLSEVPEESIDNLDELLLLGGSIWEVDQGGHGLTRRVDATAAQSFAKASSPSDSASEELKQAWACAYGRNPNASDAWDHSIKAVEEALIPIVTPAKSKATLGDVVGSLKSQSSSWMLELHGQDGSQSVAPLVAMLQLMWPNPDRHGGNASREPSLGEAEAIVHLAVTVVQWGRAGVLSKR